MERGARVVDYRVCPKEARVGVEITGAVYAEIQHLVLAGFAGAAAAAGIEPDDVVQETCAAIGRFNISNPFDPSRAAFSHYVYKVAFSQLDHLKEKQIRRDRDLVYEDPEALADLEGTSAPSPAVPFTADTAGALAEHLVELAGEARARGRAEFGAGLRAAAELLGEAFEEERPPRFTMSSATLTIGGATVAAENLAITEAGPFDRRRTIAAAARHLGATSGELQDALARAGLATSAPPHGRPGAPVAVRLAEDERAELDELADQIGLSPGLALRHLLRERRGVRATLTASLQRWREEEVARVRPSSVGW